MREMRYRRTQRHLVGSEDGVARKALEREIYEQMEKTISRKTYHYEDGRTSSQVTVRKAREMQMGNDERVSLLICGYG
jgi:hypothetical protein